MEVEVGSGLDLKAGVPGDLVVMVLLAVVEVEAVFMLEVCTF